MELDTLYSCGSNGYNEALFSDTFNFFNENFDDISLYHNFLTNDVNFLPDLNFLLDSEPLSLNSNIQHLEPLNDISDSDIPTFELLNDISNPFNYQYNLAVSDSFDYWLTQKIPLSSVVNRFDVHQVVFIKLEKWLTIQYTVYVLLKSNKNEKFDTTSMLDILFEKVSQDPRWKVYIRHQRVSPKSFWTDSEPGLINAVSQVFPITPHFYCLFHIWQNVIKHLKAKLGSNFNHFAKAFYICRNALCVEIFEKCWKLMIENFPKCENYMARLYTNRISWTKAYLPLQFNAGIQSTQSVESFNNIIKKSLNGVSTLCDVETAIDKSIDKVFTEFLSPLILSWQRFQVSQSFIYKGQLDKDADTIDNNFVEDLKHRKFTESEAFLVKAICIIPVRWYKDEILMKFDNVLKNSPVLTAISTNSATPYEVDFTLKSLKHIQGSDYKENIQQVIPQRNRFRVAISTAKTAINIALETKSDNELVQMLKSFILSKTNSNEDNLEENIAVRSNNNENNQSDSEILPLQ
ncbi:14116_t:CDS:2 [Funneliformis caledonium]|uniref:14116_t:CDS:1 n=1 Tax=Funneliformis caledonium TaxID=1117310 RepID=A0A9N9EI46_9GLOM|nr:14116_t:CDS:2 [Funneliformis caledonium]